MGEAALKLNETEEVQNKALSLVDQAGMVKITDPKSYEVAGFLWKTIGEVIKEVKETFDPIVEAAHKAHKKAVEQRSKYLDPLAVAQKKVKGLMSDYDAEQERIRREEQRRLEEEARKREEERLLQEAIEAEEEAKANGATAEVAAQVAEAVFTQPVYVPPVELPKTTPKMAGGPVFREIWSAEVVDIRLLCRAVADGKVSPECVMGNMPVLNKMATALKQTLNVPGVRAISKRV